MVLIKKDLIANLQANMSWNNIENQLPFVKVMGKNIVSGFLLTQYKQWKSMDTADLGNFTADTPTTVWIPVLHMSTAKATTEINNLRKLLTTTKLMTKQTDSNKSSV